MKINKEDWLTRAFEYPFKRDNPAVADLPVDEKGDPKQDIKKAIWQLQKCLEKMR